ncbi:MAG: hypothetical protein GY722_21860 [bacterium]|nr:hypothetical protein [bacterium]
MKLDRMARGAILALASVLVCLPAWANQELDIACEGQESGGGGGTLYQYQLTNTAGVNIDVDYFYLGTLDVNGANYSNWVAPAGFAATGIVGDNATVDGMVPITLAGMFTSGVKTAHGSIPPQGGPGTPGVVLWQCTTPPCTLVPAQTFTFGFDNANASVDVEWLTEQANGISQGFPDQPIGGPLNTFTRGWVHAPTEGQQQVPASGMIYLVILAVSLGIGLALYARSRRRQIA